MNKDEAILKELQKLIKESKAIRFEGNGYGEDWVKEAARRGLSNLKTTPQAIEVLERKEIRKLFADLEILSEREMHARVETELEKYTMRIQIEARVAGDLAQNHIIPTAFAYQNRLIENVRGLREILPAKEAEKASATQIKLIKDISLHVDQIKNNVDEMIEERKKANKITDMKQKANAYCDNVNPFLPKIKYHSDKLELLIDDELWPMPKLRELLFTR
jgi:glutamine synthetase